MNDRATGLAKFSLSEQSKLDYFVVGISAATFAYFGKTFKLVELGFNENTAVLIALLLLCISTISGVVKLNEFNSVTSLNSKYLDFLQIRTHCKTVIKNGQPLELSSSISITPQNVNKKLKETEEHIVKLQSSMNDKLTKMEICRKLRDYGLIFSYTLLFLSKLLQLLDS